MTNNTIIKKSNFTVNRKGNFRKIYIMKSGVKEMNARDKVFTEKVLKHLFVGSQVDGLEFGLSSNTTKVYFSESENHNKYEGKLYLNIESKWIQTEKNADQLKSLLIETKKYSEEEAFKKIFDLRRKKVTDIQLFDDKSPHLLIEFENEDYLLVNGEDMDYECWQAGTEFDEEIWLIVAVPGNELTTWVPDTFNEIPY